MAEVKAAPQNPMRELRIEKLVISELGAVGTEVGAGREREG